MDIKIEITDFLSKKDYEGLLNHLQNLSLLSPNNIEIKIREALLLQSVFIDDYYAALEILQGILKNSPLNIKSTLLKAYIEDTFQGEISTDSFEGIVNCLNEVPKEENNYNQLFMLKAYYYRNKINDQKLYEQSLLESIKKDPHASHNYFLLFQFYKRAGNHLLSGQFLNKAISNVRHIYAENEIIDTTDFSEFIEERLRGVHLTPPNYNSLINQKEK